VPQEGWPVEVKVKALAIAEATSLREAASQVGVPVGTIKRWRFEARAQAGERTEPASASAKKRHRNRTEPDAAAALVAATEDVGRPLRALQEPVVQQALTEAADYIAKRLTGMADQLYALAEKAIKKTDVAISDPEELPKGTKGRALPHNRDGAAWGRFLVGVISQAVEKAQLLAGKPTQRSEVLTADEARERIAGELARLAAAGAEREGPAGPH